VIVVENQIRKRENEKKGKNNKKAELKKAGENKIIESG
jgi:hypothetical protein